MRNKLTLYLSMVIIILSGCEKLEPPIPLPNDIYTEEDNYITFTSAKLVGYIWGKDAKGLKYGFYYGTDRDNLTQFANASLELDDYYDFSLKAEITGLQSGKKYYYQAAVMNNKKDELRGKVYDFITFTEGPVDLGLPSGIKWAACNLEAELPSEAGGYYAWGETEQKNYYDWTTYKYCDNGDYRDITKYIGNTDIYNKKKADGLVTLDSADDAAHKVLGGNWRIPESGEVSELFQYCDVTQVKINGTYGYKVISKKTMDEENFIFIPGTGFKRNGNINSGITACFWTSTLVQNYSYQAYVGKPSSGGYSSLIFESRELGFAIRPVIE